MRQHPGGAPVNAVRCPRAVCRKAAVPSSNQGQLHAIGLPQLNPAMPQLALA